MGHTYMYMQMQFMKESASWWVDTYTISYELQNKQKLCGNHAGYREVSSLTLLKSKPSPSIEYLQIASWKSPQ